MAIFSINEINDLYEPFPLEAHKIREGSRSKSGRIQWFVYLDRPAIQKRLDVLFPGEWSSILGEFHRSSDYVTVTTTISIRGVSRAFNGGASPKWADDDIDEDKEKGAATDSFRRAASLWGLGLYCYEGFRIWTDGYEKGDYKGQEAAQKNAWAQFTHMYNDLFKAKPQPEPPSPAKPAIVERTDITPRDDEPMARVAGAEPLTPEQVDDAKRRLGNKHSIDANQRKPKADKETKTFECVKVNIIDRKDGTNGEGGGRKYQFIGTGIAAESYSRKPLRDAGIADEDIPQVTGPWALPYPIRVTAEATDKDGKRYWNAVDAEKVE